MPKYRVQDSRTGKEFILEGDSPPTEQELEGIFASQGEPKRSFLDTAIPTAARIGGTLAGGVVGSAAGPIGTAVGAGGGGAVGELLAEAYEKSRGIRKEINPTQVAVQGALSAIPGGRAASLVRRGAQNAALGAFGVGATEVAEGRTPDIKDIATGAVIGGGLGVAIRPKRSVTTTTPKIPTQTGNVPPQSGFAGYAAKDTTIQEGLRPKPVAPELSPTNKGKTFFGDPFTPVPKAEGMDVAQRLGPKPGETFSPRKGIQLKSFPKEIQPSLRSVIEEHQGFEPQRRSVQTWARTSALSQKIAIDLKTTLPKGRVLNAEEQGAYGNALTSITSKLDDLLNRAPSTLSPNDLLKIEELRAAQNVTFASLWGTVTETGRALNYWKALKAGMESHDERFIKQALEVAQGDIEKVRTALKDLKDPIARYQWLRENQKALSWGDAFRTYVYGNMLSGPRTHGRNFIGNTARVLFDLAAEAPIRPIATTHKAMGILSAIPRASKEFAFHMQQGFSREAAETSAFDKIYKELPGGGLNPWNDVLRLLSASDSFTKSLIRNGELYHKAYREALKEGKKGQALIGRAAELREVPKAEWLAEADKVAINTVFQDKLGPVATHLQKAVNSIPGGFMVMPFVKIATNITKAGAEASPLGFIKAKGMEPGRLKELANARAAAGSALLVLPVWLASQGLISGNGPKDPTKKALLMDSGWIPNAIKIGDRWVEYSNFQPVGVPFAVVANFAEAVKESQEEGRELSLEQAAGEVIARTANSVLSQSFLQGVNNVIQALTDQTPLSISKVAKGFVQQVIPFSAAMRTTTQAIDPTIRIPEGIVQTGQEIIPGLSKRVEPLLNPYGRPTKRTGNPLNPIRVSPEVNDPVTNFLLTNKVSLARPSRRLEGADGKPIKLARPEQTALAMARGFSKRDDLERAVRRGEGRSPDRQKELAEEAKRASSESITYLARRQKRQGETLDPRKLVNRRLVDELYQSYLSSR